MPKVNYFLFTPQIFCLILFTDFIFKSFKCKKKLGDYFLRDFNKLEQLYMAKLAGLRVPETIVGSNSDEFLQLKNREKITKPISNLFTVYHEGYVYYSYVKEVLDNDLDKRTKNFFPSLIQMKVNRKYELRIFFFNKVLFPMAIFSNDKNNVDIREKNQKNKKRFVPFKLNNEISEKIFKFVDISGLSTGSIDMIIDEDDNYYFLEVNPCGQFDYLNKYCNYYIEKEIANFFT